MTQIMTATTSHRISDNLESALDKAVLLEQSISSYQQRDELLSEFSPYHQLLAEEIRLNMHRRLRWILLAVAGTLTGFGTVLLAEKILLAPSELLVWLPAVLGIIAALFGAFSALSFKRRNKQIEFESEVLDVYLNTRSELLRTQMDKSLHL